MEVRKPDGTLMWSTEEFGQTDVDRTSDIAEILRDLLKNVKINMDASEMTVKIDPKSLLDAGVYSTTQVDEKFSDLASVYATIQSVNDLSSKISIQSVYETYLYTLWNTLYDKNYTGLPTTVPTGDISSTTSLSARISKLESSSDGYSSDIASIKVYLYGRDGSGNVRENTGGVSSSIRTLMDSDTPIIVEVLNKIFGFISDSVTSSSIGLTDTIVGSIKTNSDDISEEVKKTGKLSDLKTDSKTSMVSAINEVKDNIGDMSDVEEKTENTDIMGMLKEIYDKLSDISDVLNGTETEKGLIERVADLENA